MTEYLITIGSPVHWISDCSITNMTQQIIGLGCSVVINIMVFSLISRMGVAILCLGI
jgi:uncharacterized membrane protein YgaE (UPF0421/DUF939 family)